MAYSEAHLLISVAAYAEAMPVAEPDHLARQRPAGQLLRALGPFLAPQRWRLIGAVTATLMIGALGLAFPWVLGSLVDSALRSDAGLADLNRAALLLLGIFAGQALLTRLRILFLAVAGQRIVNALRSALFNRMIRLPMAALGGRTSGALTARLMSDAAFAYGSAAGAMPQMVFSGVTVLGSTALMLAIDPTLAAVVLLLVPVAAVIAVFYGRRMRNLSRGYQNGLAATNGFAADALAAAPVIKWFSAERAVAAGYHGRLQEVSEQGIIRGRARARWTPTMMFLASLAVIGVVWVGGRQVQSGGLSAGALVSFLLYARFVADGLSSLVTDYSRLAQALGAIERVLQMLDEPIEEIGGGGADPQRSIVRVAQRLGRVEFRAVRFTYPGRHQPALNRLDMTIPAGSTVALVGPSGAGKSTVAALIARLFDPDEGVVLVDGADVREQDLTELRRALAIVPQDPMLLAGSVADNIRLGRRNASREQVRSAAEAANALSFIEALPRGFATRVGERGGALSGGQRQRIAIARAVLADPKLLILDEATNALDGDSEILVHDALRRLMAGRTNVVIAHRLRTVLDADQVLVLDGGEIVESGTPAALMRGDSRFAAMVSAQSLGVVAPPSV